MAKAHISEAVARHLYRVFMAPILHSRPKESPTTIVPHNVGIDNVADIPKLVFQVLPGRLPGEIADIAALANAHDTAILAILVTHFVAA